MKNRVENLVPECGCVSAAFYVAAHGIVDDLRTTITRRHKFKLLEDGCNPTWQL